MTLPPKTILLSGLPRSGTTLLCALLNEAKNTLALVEPVRFDPSGNIETALEDLSELVMETREAVSRHREVVTRAIGDQIADMIVGDVLEAGGLRPMIANRGKVHIDRELSSDFTLFIKHHGEFTSMGGRLRLHYPLFAVVRHPLFAMAAWQGVDLPIRQGHLRSAEYFDPELRRRLAAEPDRLTRQAMLIDWHFRAYSQWPRNTIVTYEDLVADPVTTLSRLIPNPAPLKREVHNFNDFNRYSDSDLKALARALMPFTESLEYFYPGVTETIINISH